MLYAFGTPLSGTDVTNKLYVDSAIAGLTVKSSVRCATTTAGTLATSFAAGQEVDGVVLALDDRILIKNQEDGKENGIYDVTADVPTRSEDADNSPGSEVLQGMFVTVVEGTANAGTGWTMTSPSGVATLGEDSLVFEQFSAFIYTAGTGLDLSSQEFSVKYGAAAGTACQGNDARLSDSRQLV